MQPKNDPYIIAAEKAIAGITATGNPGAFLVDMLPICTLYPSLFSTKLLSCVTGSEVCSRVVSWSTVSKEG